MKKIILGLAAGACLLTACTGSTSVTVGGDSTATKTANNVKTALASEQAIIKKDIDAIYKDYAKSFVEYGNGEMPAVTNIDTLKAGMKQFTAAFPDLKADDLKTVAQGDSVVVIGTWSGTFKNDFMGFKANNKTFKSPDVDIFVFNKDGQIISHRGIQSEATYFKQLDLKVPETKK